jgi:glycosyltransferase involved in cell wall biosynthesis
LTLNNSKIITIIIPCYNEIDTIGLIVDRINNLKNLNKQIIVVDDCSVDGTANYIKDRLINKIDRLILHNQNQGKGAAIKSAQQYVTGDVVIIQDADLEYSPEDYYELVYPIINNNYKVVYGSRVLNKKRYLDKNFTSIFRILANHILTIASNIINNQNLTDAHTCYKVFSSSIFKNLVLEENDFSFCPEVTTKISKLNIKIYEVPIKYSGRSYKEGKKIKFSDGIKAIIVLLKYRFFKK